MASQSQQTVKFHVHMTGFRFRGLDKGGSFYLSLNFDNFKKEDELTTDVVHGPDPSWTKSFEFDYETTAARMLSQKKMQATLKQKGRLRDTVVCEQQIRLYASMTGPAARQVTMPGGLLSFELTMEQVSQTVPVLTDVTIELLDGAARVAADAGRGAVAEWGLRAGVGEAGAATSSLAASVPGDDGPARVRLTAAGPAAGSPAATMQTLRELLCEAVVVDVVRIDGVATAATGGRPAVFATAVLPIHAYMPLDATTAGSVAVSVDLFPKGTPAAAMHAAARVGTLTCSLRLQDVPRFAQMPHGLVTDEGIFDCQSLVEGLMQPDVPVTPRDGALPHLVTRTRGPTWPRIAPAGSPTTTRPLAADTAAAAAAVTAQPVAAAPAPLPAPSRGGSEDPGGVADAPSHAGQHSAVADTAHAAQRHESAAPITAVFAAVRLQSMSSPRGTPRADGGDHWPAQPQADAAAARAAAETPGAASVPEPTRRISGPHPDAGMPPPIAYPGTGRGAGAAPSPFAGISGGAPRSPVDSSAPMMPAHMPVDMSVDAGDAMLGAAGHHHMVSPSMPAAPQHTLAVPMLPRPASEPRLAHLDSVHVVTIPYFWRVDADARGTRVFVNELTKVVEYTLPTTPEYEIVVESAGPLGMQLEGAEGSTLLPRPAPSVVVVGTLPDGLAASVPAITPGVSIIAVGGQSVLGAAFDDVIGLLRSTPRPLRVIFFDASGGGRFSVEFGVEGALGMQLEQVNGAARPNPRKVGVAAVGVIFPGSLASSVQHLRPGHVLSSIGGQPAGPGTPFEAVIQQLQYAPRPLRMRFYDPFAVTRAVADAAAAFDAVIQSGPAPPPPATTGAQEPRRSVDRPPPPLQQYPPGMVMGAGGFGQPAPAGFAPGFPAHGGPPPHSDFMDPARPNFFAAQQHLQQQGAPAGFGGGPGPAAHYATDPQAMAAGFGGGMAPGGAGWPPQQPGMGYPGFGGGPAGPGGFAPGAPPPGAGGFHYGDAAATPPAHAAYPGAGGAGYYGNAMGGPPQRSF